jgi:hypothetical protein
MKHDSRWRVVSFTLRPLYPGIQTPQNKMDKMLSEPQRRSGFGEEQKNPSSCRRQNVGHTACSLVTILTELSRLLLLKFCLFRGGVSVSKVDSSSWPVPTMQLYCQIRGAGCMLPLCADWICIATGLHSYRCCPNLIILRKIKLIL